MSPGAAARLSPWGRLVLVCAVLLGAAAIALLTWSVASGEQRQVSYSVKGGVDGVVLDLGDADVEIQGGGRSTAILVAHVDRFGFGHGPVTRRAIEGGMFLVRSSCPTTVLHGCSVRYRVTVPDNVPLTVTTGDGSVRFRGYRGSARVTTGDGDIDVTGFCGFSLQARSEGSGDVDAVTACSPAQLSLRTTTGAVRARVPAGRYRIDASTSSGRPQIRGVAADAGAPFAIQALSSSGAVSVERAP